MELKHREMLRLVNPKPDEYYLIPRPLDKSDFHISYHRSGAFHWKLNRKLCFPKENRDDFSSAFFDYISMQSYFGWIVAHCLACDPKLERAVLREMLRIITPYVPIPGLDTDEACDDLFNRKRTTQKNRIVRPGTIIQRHPLASGLMLAEMKASRGTLHTLNITLTDDRVLRVHRRTLNPHTSEFEFSPVEMESIHEKLFVLM